jgi:peroxiredoxin
MKDLQKEVSGITLLTDIGLKVADAWGLKVAGAEHPSPGTFVITRDGKVAWRRLEQNGSDWPTWDEVAAALAKA